MKINGREILQTGYYPFHKDNAFNFQMKRDWRGPRGVCLP